MDSSISSLELSSLDPGPISPIIETRKPTEQQRQLASKVTVAFFSKKNYTEASGLLATLATSRPTDPRVTGNLAMVRFLMEGENFNQLAGFQTDLKKTYISILSESGAEYEASEIPVFIYNLALCAYYNKKFDTAEKLLDQVYLSFCCPSSSPPSPPTTPSQTSLTFKFKNVLPLCVAVSLKLNKPTQALMYLSEAEALAKQLDEESSFGARCLLFRAHALVLSKQFKIFKRDMKPTGLSLEQVITYEFIRANLEYLKGNHRKAAKLLSLVCHQSSDPLLSSFYSNNIGCLHLMLSKPFFAVFYFSEALQKHSAFIADQKEKRIIRKDIALNIKQAEIVYNLGIALLHSGQHEKAFQSFSNCLSNMSSNPSLWLHLAECCIAANKKTTSHEIKHFYGNGNSNKNDNNNNDNESPNKTLVSPVGSGLNKKLIIKPSNLQRRVSQTTNGPIMSLEYAAQCLKNALALCGHPEINEKPAASISPKGNGNSSSANSSAQTSPVKSVSQVPKQFLLRGSILINSAYVALCLSNPQEALKFCQKLLEFNSNGILPSGYKILAHLYASESLIQLDRISDAIEHLDPSNVQEVSFSDVIESVEESPGGKKNLTDSQAAAKTVFHFNLIVAFTMRGELDNAENLLEKFWLENRDRDRFGINLQMLTLRMYIQLAKGNIEKCRELAREQMLLYK